MRHATRFGLMLCALVLWAGSAFAQEYDVTFQVDMSACITSGQFDPATETITTPGDMNGWDNTAFPLADGNSDGVYTGTFSLPAGNILYKFYSSGPLGWENDPNREYTVTTDPSQTVDLAEFDRGSCGGAAEDYEIIFSVDMNVQIARGAFDPMTQEVHVAGELNGWDGGSDDFVLTESTTNDGVYTGLFQVSGLPTPSTQNYKFTTEDDMGNIGWESGDNRTFEITGNETDADANGFQEIVVPLRFFDDVTFDDVLDTEATVTYVVDVRPAFYVLEDTGVVPGNEDQTAVNGVYLNGPAMWESNEAGGPGGGVTDWLGWTGELEGTDYGSDMMSPDSTFSFTLTYPVGALRTLVGKFGVNGRDNEAGFGADSYFRLQPGSQTITHVFGTTRLQSGLFGDDQGPDADGDGDSDPVYDPYILIDNGATPPIVEVVRSGGEADGTATANEPGGELPAGLALGQNYPNPFNPTTQIAFRVESGQAVTLGVYDLTGRLVAMLVDGFVPAGEHSVRFDARDLASGTYLYRLEASGRVETRMMSLLK